MLLSVCPVDDIVSCASIAPVYVDAAVLYSSIPELTVENVVAVFMAGFSAVLTMWALGLVLGAVLSVIRKL